MAPISTGPWSITPTEKSMYRRKSTEPRLESGSRKVIFAIFEDFVKNRIQRYNQKCPQSFVDKIKPFHLTDDIKYIGLSSGRNQEGFNRLINCRNKCKRAKGKP